jgi:hypothetical protein
MTPEKCPTCNIVDMNTPHTCFGFAPAVSKVPKDYQEIERIAKEITDKVCYYATPNQYVADSEEQKAYLEGVSTAIAMLYIDLTGTPKTKGILASLTEAHKVETEKERLRIWLAIVKLADDYTGELNTHLDEIDKIIRFNIEVK